MSELGIPDEEFTSQVTSEVTVVLRSQDRSGNKSNLRRTRVIREEQDRSGKEILRSGCEVM